MVLVQKPNTLESKVEPTLSTHMIPNIAYIHCQAINNYLSGEEIITSIITTKKSGGTWCPHVAIAVRTVFGRFFDTTHELHIQ